MPAVTFTDVNSPCTFTFPPVVTVSPEKAPVTDMPFVPLPPFSVTLPLTMLIVPPAPVTAIVPSEELKVPLPDIVPNESVFSSISIAPTFVKAPVTVTSSPSVKVLPLSTVRAAAVFEELPLFTLPAIVRLLYEAPAKAKTVPPEKMNVPFSVTCSAAGKLKVSVPAA